MSTNPNRHLKLADEYGLSLMPTPGIDSLREKLEKKGLASEAAELLRIIQDMDTKLENARDRLVKQDNEHSKYMVEADWKAKEAEGTYEQKLADLEALLSEAKAKAAQSSDDDTGGEGARNTNNNEKGNHNEVIITITDVDVTSMCVDTYLLTALQTVTDRSSSDARFQMAYKYVNEASKIARQAGDKSRLARCQFYAGLIALRSRAVKRATNHFQTAAKSTQSYPESKWVQAWVDECDKVGMNRDDDETELKSPIDSVFSNAIFT